MIASNTSLAVDVIDKPTLFVVGATGSGKSSFALSVCKRLSAAGRRPLLISCDAMQCGPGLPIATNKPSEEEMRVVEHAMVGVAQGGKPMTSHLYATQALQHCRREDVDTLVICGGTMQYVEALLYSNVTSSSASETESGAPCAVPSKCYEDGEHAYQVLCSLDPAFSAQVHPRDRRRVLGALEWMWRANGEAKMREAVFNGRTYSEELESARGRQTVRFARAMMLWLRVDDTERHATCLSERVDQMIERGLLTELIAYFDSVGPGGASATREYAVAQTQAIGYKELLPWLSDRENERALQQCVDRLKVVTARYAKQ